MSFLPDLLDDLDATRDERAAFRRSMALARGELERPVLVVRETDAFSLPDPERPSKRPRVRS
jgi:predicted RNA polymerase sigma factor